MANFVSGIVQLAIGVVVLSSVFITTVKNTNTSTWTSGEVALWGVLTLAAIASLVNGVFQVFGN